MAVNFSKRVLRRFLGKCIVEIFALDREKAITRLRAVITRGYDGFARPFANDCRPVNAKPKWHNKPEENEPRSRSDLYRESVSLALPPRVSRRDACHRIACHSVARFRSITVNETLGRKAGEENLFRFVESSSGTELQGLYYFLDS